MSEAAAPVKRPHKRILCQYSKTQVDIRLEVPKSTRPIESDIQQRFGVSVKSQDIRDFPSRELVTISVKMPSNRVLNWILTVHPALMNPLYFKCVQDITESVGTWKCTTFAIDFKLSTLTISIGDGCTPRTAYTAYYLWEGANDAKSNLLQVHSIDPVLNTSKEFEPNLMLHKMFSNEWMETHWPLLEKEIEAKKWQQVIVFAVHCHADLRSYLPTIIDTCCRNQCKLIFSCLPCCIPHDLSPEWTSGEWGSFSHEHYEHWGIHSPFRLVHVYIWTPRNELLSS
eukprot:TRINITY_DN32702_c0_g1_i1.p1 TRINITY_DN32702_c0_g1~~TRINITY_DN32702_c0_g1_i1.p1  ORF type:complete len:284 (+),score=46.85 TRINITY_DN32702_c0_g1_i1:7-858(+)